MGKRITKKHLRSTRKRVRSTRKRRQRGGRFLGQGTSGNVFTQPPLRCRGPPPPILATIPRERIVSKLGEKNVIDAEFGKALNKIYNITPNKNVRSSDIYPFMAEFSKLPLATCEWNRNLRAANLAGINPAQNRLIERLQALPASEEPMSLLFTEYGGRSLEDIMELDLWKGKTPVEMKQILLAFQRLLKQVEEMNFMSIYWNDLHAGNILYNEEENKFYIIDTEHVVGAENVHYNEATNTHYTIVRGENNGKEHRIPLLGDIFDTEVSMLQGIHEALETVDSLKEIPEYQAFDATFGDPGGYAANGNPENAPQPMPVVLEAFNALVAALPNA